MRLTRLMSHLAPSKAMNWVGAVDQGTTSSRFIVFDENRKTISMAQEPVTLSTPKPGWAEQDAGELLASVSKCIRRVKDDIEARYGIGSLGECLKGVGITNQRETSIAWDKEGKPIGPAIVWMDTRTKDWLKDIAYEQKGITGLPLSPYFSASKMRWILDNYPKTEGIKFGTVDSWLLWNLAEGTPHITDHTNASRTLLYSLKSHCYDKGLLTLFGIKEDSLPKILDAF